MDSPDAVLGKIDPGDKALDEVDSVGTDDSDISEGSFDTTLSSYF
jgi:hypothetical protein